MRTRAIAGFAVTELGFGGASVGNLYRATSDEDAAAAVDAAWDGGIRYFDTAPHYGLGLSERRLGAALGSRPRDEFVLSTKVGRLLEPNPAPTGSDLAAGGFDVPDDLVRRFDFSRDAVLRSVADSLTRLNIDSAINIDSVNIVYLHDPDDHLDAAVSEAAPALVELREQGVIAAVGVGTNHSTTALRMVRETDLDVVMLAGRWTLLDRSGAELLAECERRGVKVVAAAPYNSGLLARDRPAPDARFDYGAPPAEVRARAEELADVCERHGTRLPVAALRFPLRSPQVSAVVCGMRDAEQVRATIARLGASIAEDTWEALDA
jgi:D-threo-aldose 1-dehydrogenase